jgi:hypothetical protein
MTQALVDDSTFNKIGYSAAPLQPGGAQSTT